MMSIVSSQAHPPPDRENRDCRFMHVDMDAFFVGVELLEAPHLRGRAVIVGSAQGRSVVLSASYEARAYGVHSAMPMTAARRLCPHAVVIEPHQSRYRDVSAALMSIFNSITDLVEPLSVDEAFLDVSGAVRRLGPPRDIGELIRREVAGQLGITASVGIAATKFVAKIASTRAKPDGLLLIPADRTVEFLHTLPVSALWGVGEKTRQVLARLGISTVADVAQTPVPSLRKVLGATGEHVHRLAWGQDDRGVVPVREEKSLGAEETFAVDVCDDAVLHRELLRLAHRTASRLRLGRLQCRTVSIKVRYEDFSTLTRSKTLTVAADGSHTLYEAAVSLLTLLGPRPMRIRLIGLRAESLEPADGRSRQLSLDPRDENRRAAEEALDEVNRKFGSYQLQPARLLTGPALRHEGPRNETARREGARKETPRKETPRNEPGRGEQR